MKKLMLLLMVLYTCTFFPQGKESIIASGDYYYGESTSENEQEARDAALKRLTDMIAITVSSSFQRLVKENSKSFEDNVESVLKTYSTATLKNVKELLRPNDGGISVFYYIEKSEVLEIFRERTKLISDIVLNAEHLMKDGNAGYALKYYYFAALLMNSIPEQNVIYNSTNFSTEIPLHVQDILSKIEFRYISDTLQEGTERLITLRVDFQDKPAKYLEFSFWDGTAQVNVEVKDGIAKFVLLGSSINFKELELAVKYSYYEAREEIKAIAEIWNAVMKPSFRNMKKIALRKEGNTALQRPADAILPSTLRADMNARAAARTASATNTFTEGKLKLTFIADSTCGVLKQIARETFGLLTKLQTGKSERIRAYFSGDPFLADKIANVLTYNAPMLTSNEMTVSVNKTYSGWELRQIETLNRYRTIRKQTREHIILDFDEQGKIYDVNFGITENLYQDFVQKGIEGEDWTKRQVIIKFVERYRTAFLGRNLEMIDSMFADEAVIIVGRIPKKSAIKDVYKYVKINDAQPDAKYTTYTKASYLKMLAQKFKTQPDIFLGYSTFNIRRKNSDEPVYGMSMRQNYNATNYSDEGYLFLLVDFKDKQPQIYVRAWQPQEWSEDALIRLSNFTVNK